MQESVQQPVVIVGAGVAGSMLALELARHGIDFHWVDRLAGPSPFSKAITVHARSLEIFNQISPALLARFMAGGIECPGYVMHFVDDHGTRREVRPGLDFRPLPSRFPYLLLHGQHHTEAALRAHLAENFGRTPQWGTACVDLHTADDGVEVSLTTSDGQHLRVDCRYLVACDGAGSRVRELAGFTQASDDVYADVVLQNLDVQLTGFPDDPDWVHYCMGPGHFLMVARLPGDMFRLLLSQPAAVADAEATALEVFSEILARHYDGVGFGATVWHSRWQSRARLADQYRRGNVFLAGDAAHVHSTGGGQGLNCCLQDSYNLGWKLALVAQGLADPKLLDTYEAERQPIGRQVIAAATSIHDLFMAGRASSPATMLKMQQQGELVSLINQVSGLAYHYRTDANAAAGGLAAGDRMPDVLLPAPYGDWLSSFLRHGGFTLLVVGEASMTMPSMNEIQAISADSRLPITHLRVVGGRLAEGGNNQLPWLYLVRPDGYLAISCHWSDRAQCRDHLKSLAAPS
ncbi:MAG: FAD-dependent monooxygenase [Gammaproteobacteria bacterium]|nr:FAD-dependent monooxygenase [Gammaproteobacteria bacterium]